MPRAEKRQRKKDNARAARAEREAAIKRRKRIRTAITVAAIAAGFVVFVLLFNLLTGDDNKKDVAANSTTTTAPSSTTSVFDPAKTYTATVTTNLGQITLALDTKNAPIGAGHFIKLAREGKYNGSRWHRIVKDFVIQGGAPGGDLTKSNGDAVVGEVGKNNYAIGDLAAAKTGQDPPGTFDGQFFIVTGSQGSTLPNEYAKFGKVTAGMDVVNKIAALVPANPEGGEPTSKATIDKVVITET